MPPLCHYLCEWAVYKHSTPSAVTPLYFPSIAVSRIQPALGEALSGPDHHEGTWIEFRYVAGKEGPLIF